MAQRPKPDTTNTDASAVNGPVKRRADLIELDMQALQESAEMGATFSQLAKSAGVSVTTLKRRAKDTPGVQEIVDSARDAVMNIAHDSFVRNLQEGHPGVTMYAMKALWKLSDRPEMESAVHAASLISHAVPLVCQMVTELTGKSVDPIEVARKLRQSLPETE